MTSKRLRQKRSLPVGPLPPRVAWLDGISMDVTPLVSRPRASYRRVDYLLTVRCQSRDSTESSTWHLVRSFDQFRFFRKRLVAALKRGHFCQAECPWLYTFLKSYFPKSQLVGGSLSRVVARRRKTLTRSLATIRSFLMNRSNHVCPLVMQGVALELLEFVVGGSLEPEDDRHGEVPGWMRQLLQRWQDGDLELEDSTSSDDTAASDDSGMDKETCALCENSLVGHPPTERRPELEGDRWSQLAAAEPFSTLSCGHHFHDECLIDKLNEVLECPTCGNQETW
uniref:RING-type domain-containing protein n=1 Tax=Phytophthora ramorum TaxID=164328 RepID=H3GYS5_PHYRM